MVGSDAKENFLKPYLLERLKKHLPDQVLKNNIPLRIDNLVLLRRTQIIISWWKLGRGRVVLKI